MIQILFNYWEYKPTQFGQKLNELMRSGVSELVSFVPWQCAESDISHSLTRYLQAIHERGISLSLILTPEVGVHYGAGGVPKDLLIETKGLARTAAGQTARVHLPPVAHAVPSLQTPEFNKRYQAFLTRVDGVLADLFKSHPALRSRVSVVISGSYWKYLRSAADCVVEPFGGEAGDYSEVVELQFRQAVERFFAGPEFSTESQLENARWKSHQNDQVNRRWFHRQCEEVFRLRSAQSARRKSQATLKQVEIFTPEADPYLGYSSFFQLLTQGHGDLSRLSLYLDEAACRIGSSAGEAIPSWIHWCGLGNYEALSEPEKQFLILKSLLLVSSRGGAVLVDHAEWLRFSSTFRTRASSLMRMVQTGSLTLKTGAAYLVPHLWSGAGNLWKELHQRLGARAVATAVTAGSVGTVGEAKLLVADPSVVFTRQLILQLAAVAEQGCVVAIPRTALFSPEARAEVEEILASGQPIQMELGAKFQLQMVGQGRFIVFDLPESDSGSVAADQAFLTALLSLSEIQSHCTLSGGRLDILSFEKAEGGLGLFILNGSVRAVAADLHFPQDVRVSDLVSSRAQPGAERVLPSQRFAMEVPPCGILPVSVEGEIEPKERVGLSTPNPLFFGAETPTRAVQERI